MRLYDISERCTFRSISLPQYKMYDVCVCALNPLNVFIADILAIIVAGISIYLQLKKIDSYIFPQNLHFYLPCLYWEIALLLIGIYKVSHGR